MTRRTPTSRAYKEITLQQLRSFCETARLGSLSAAAASLGMAHPTVWKQVHALEREFGTQLVESTSRGCRLTPAGRLLAELASPTVAGIASLKRCFQERLAQVESSLRVAASPRTVVDDLPECLAEFERCHPHMRLTLKEMRHQEVNATVEAGKVDLGLVGESAHDPKHPWLTFERCYELDVYLVTSRDHPLARRRQVRPGDLAGYPFVNSPEELADACLQPTLKRLGVVPSEKPRMEASFAHTIRRYVALGFGIALIGSLPSRRPEPDLRERLMSRYFGRLPVYLVRRRGVVLSDAARAFTEVITGLLTTRPR